jgi:hypothetical protein
VSDGKAPVGRPQERIRVIVRQKVRGADPLDHDVLWPKGWPLPEVGSVVMAGPLAGFVEHIEFDLDAARILVILR